MRRFVATFLIAFALVALPGLLGARSAHALSQDKRTLAIAGAYGLAGGALLGLGATPTTGIKGVFIGSSIGLYLGLIIGLYHIHHREDPYNPLNPRGEYSGMPRGSVTLARGPGSLASVSADSGASADPGVSASAGPDAVAPPLVEVQVPLLRF